MTDSTKAKKIFLLQEVETDRVAYSLIIEGKHHLIHLEKNKCVLKIHYAFSLSSLCAI